MNEITIGDKVYISAKRAAEITGYARDYVGQLSREGHVDAKMVGRSWYVFEPSIRAHRFGPESVIAPERSATEPALPASASQEAQQGANATGSGWNTPTYTPEAPDMLPELTPASLEELLPPAQETLTDMQSAWREWFEQKQRTLETPEIESPEVIDARNEAHEAAEEKEDVEDDDAEDDFPEEDTAEEATEEEVVIPIHHIAPEVPEYAPALAHAPAAPTHMDINREIAAPMPVMEERVPISRYSGEYAAPQAPQGRVVSERVVTQKGKRTRAGKPVRRSRTSNAPIIAVLVGISLISIAIAFIGTGYASRYLRTLPAENNPVINFLIGTEKITR